MSQNNQQQNQQKAAADKAAADKAAAEKAQADKAAADKAAAEKAQADKAAAKEESFTPKKGNEGHYHVEVENITADRLGNILSKPDVIKLAPKMFEIFKKAEYSGYDKVKVLWDGKKKKATNEVLASPEKVKSDKLSRLDAAETKAKEAQAEIDQIRKELEK